MLIKFKFKNFLSYKDETTLLLTQVPSFKEHLETHVNQTGKSFNVLKSSAIFGTNGGGKSNLIGALSFMDSFVHNSFSDSLKSSSDRFAIDYYFKLSTENTKKPTEFEVTFLENQVIYRYGFKIIGYNIVSEWLYKKVESETLLFKREKSTFDINKTGFPEGEKYYKEVNENVLFLSHLAQYNSEVAREVFNWFSFLNAVSALNDQHYKSVTSNLLNDDIKFRAWLKLAVRFLEISNIDVTENNEIITYHNKFDANNVIVDTVSLNFEREESDGTRKLIYLLGAIYDTLVNGKVLFIDELDSKLHPNLTRKLVHLFHKLNRKNAQFVFSAQDANLLDKDLFRRDQIWFVDKDKFGASQLYPMSDFDSSVVRNTSDFRKKYLLNVFGAAEAFHVSDQMSELLK
jgi:AAA15 family ATPase/GTPase